MTTLQAPAGLKRLPAFNHQMLLLVLTIIMFCLLSLFKPGQFLTITNMQSMSFQFSEVGILAIAMSLAILLAGIDLSVVATANLSSILAAIYMTNAVSNQLPGDSTGMIISGGVLIALFAGSLCGMINGLLIGYVGVPAILATLSTMTLFGGIAMGITNGQAVSRMPEGFEFLGNGLISGIPAPLILFVLVGFAVWLILERTRFGTEIYLLGTNPRSSIFSGIENARIAFYVHTLIGFLSALCGLIMLSRTNSASAGYGASYILTTILIAAMGGISVLGGKGKMTGVLISTVLLQMVSTGFNMLLYRQSGGNFFRDFVWGALLVLVIAFMHWHQNRKI